MMHGDPWGLELSPAQEDYLKHILRLGGREGWVSTQALADTLQVKPPSVTEMVRRLADLGLLEHRPYRGVSLSDRGHRAARELVRHHRLLETFLVEVLGMGGAEVHEEAERLEHVLSRRLEERIAAVLGHPATDPHGRPIPAADHWAGPGEEGSHG